MKQRILLLCSARSLRSLMAASLLASNQQTRWDIWSTPVQQTTDYELVRRVLAEIQVPLLQSPQVTEPLPGLSWNAGVILCSGAADT